MFHVGKEKYENLEKRKITEFYIFIFFGWNPLNVFRIIFNWISTRDDFILFEYVSFQDF